jgi:hypothetical protein
MLARSMFVVLALASLVGCHRRTFETRDTPREDTIVTSTTVITNAEVEPQPQAPPPVQLNPTATETFTPQPAAPLAETRTEPPPPPAANAPRGSDRYSIIGTSDWASNMGLRDGGSPQTQQAEPSTPAPAPGPAAPSEEPPRRRASAADRDTWAGDSVRR